MICHYAECRTIFTIMLSVVMLSVVAPEQPILMFGSKAGAYLSEAPTKWSTLG
jgi:hypothetical protein